MCAITSLTFDAEEDLDEDEDTNVHGDNLYIVSKKGQVNFSSAGRDWAFIRDHICAFYFIRCKG